MQKLNDIPTCSDLLKKHKSLKTVLWDMDGTLMKTEPLHSQSTYSLHLDDCKINNLPHLKFEEIDQLCWGEIDALILQKLQSQNYFKDLSLTRFIQEKNTLILDALNTIDQQSIVKKELRDLLRELKENNISMAIVTSSEKELTLKLTQTLGLSEYFEYIITREDTRENKPSPAPYLYAMKLLNKSPGDCIIFEDSQTGLKAANQSGAFTYQVMWYLD